MENTHSYDVVVVGGGAAGLSGALALGRARRTVLVVDAGDPRNAPAGHVHNYLGREGTPPAELLEIGRTEVAAYGVEVRRGRVTTATRSDAGFELALDHGSSVHARRLLVTTGLTDVLPDVPGLAARFGRDVLHCPYCHGWEVRDQAIGLIASNAFAMHGAQLWGQWSDDVTLFLNDRFVPSAEEAELLAARGVTVVEGPVAEVVVEEDRLVGVRLENGEVVAREALVAAPQFVANSDLLTSLGLQPEAFEMNGIVFGYAVPSDANGATTVPGIWLAGNVTDLRAQVISAAAGGLNAGAMINMDLIEEETAAAVEIYPEEVGMTHDHGQSHGEITREHFEQSSWDERYGGDGRTWSGRPNAVLVAETSALTPGRAVDLGCGEGGDAIWLAEQGWQVTAIDFSEAGLRKAAEHAEERGVADRIDFRQADLRTWTPDGEEWDLVTSCFLHLLDHGMVDATRQMAAAVAPGGTLLVAGHHPDDEHTGLRWSMPGVMFTAEELAPAVDTERFDVRAEAPTRTETRNDETHTVTDAVLVARRR